MATDMVLFIGGTGAALVIMVVMGAGVPVGAWGCPSEMTVTGGATAAAVEVGTWGCPSEMTVTGGAAGAVAVGA